MRFYKRTNMGVQWLSVLARIALGGVFIWSALYKIKWPYMFLGSVYDYEIVGPRCGILIAMVLPWTELFVGVCLLGNVLTRGAIVMAGGMMGLFVFLHAYVISKGLGISCGCFSGSAVEPVGYLSLITNCLLLALCLVYFVFSVDRDFPGAFKRDFLRRREGAA
jgi:hypothetical protein